MTMGDEHQDHYSAAIDLSNNCRRFYYNHMKTTEEFKRSVSRSRTDGAGRPNGTMKSRLDSAMDKLRTEMVGFFFISFIFRCYASNSILRYAE